MALIAGPCQMESRAHALETAIGAEGNLCGARNRAHLQISFDKANRTSASGQRGIGLEGALPVFAEIRDVLGLPVLTDVHDARAVHACCRSCRHSADSAFLCRQTDLLLAAAATGRVVNVKKGQFLAPWDMQHVVAKVTGVEMRTSSSRSAGPPSATNTLVTDFRGLPIMAAQTGAPIIFDATIPCSSRAARAAHPAGSVEFVPVLARAAVSVGVAGLFIETTPTGQGTVRRAEHGAAEAVRCADR